MQPQRQDGSQQTVRGSSFSHWFKISHKQGRLTSAPAAGGCSHLLEHCCCFAVAGPSLTLRMALSPWSRCAGRGGGTLVSLHPGSPRTLTAKEHVLSPLLGPLCFFGSHRMNSLHKRLSPCGDGGFLYTSIYPQATFAPPLRRALSCSPDPPEMLGSRTHTLWIAHPARGARRPQGPSHLTESCLHLCSCSTS